MISIFNNRSVGTIITVDLDVFIDDFLKNPRELSDDAERPNIHRLYIIDQIRRLEKRLAILNHPTIDMRRFVINAAYRRSSKGHVHVRLTFPYEVSVLDAFMIRAFMKEGFATP